MNRYSEMSDFEINKLIAEKLGYKYVCDDLQGAVLVEGVSSGYGGYKIIVLKKNYCTDYQDAMSLMIDNEIGLVKGKNSWFAEDGERLRVSNANPCRAIAECFLLMKDAERGENG